MYTFNGDWGDDLVQRLIAHEQEDGQFRFEILTLANYYMLQKLAGRLPPYALLDTI